MSYKLKFIDVARLMASLLLNLADNLTEEIHEIQCKYGHNNKNYKPCRTKYKDCECYLEYTNAKDD